MTLREKIDNNKRNHLRKVSGISFLMNGAEEVCISNKSGVGQLYFVNEFHGDHDENWVIEIVEGKEKARHNVRFIMTITFDMADRDSSFTDPGENPSEQVDDR